MAKKTVLYCWDCGAETIHRKVCAEKQGFERVAEAIFSIGFSEILMEHYWECSKCGGITQK